jgi:hypothetical protein
MRVTIGRSCSRLAATQSYLICEHIEDAIWLCRLVNFIACTQRQGDMLEREEN